MIKKRTRQFMGATAGGAGTVGVMAGAVLGRRQLVKAMANERSRTIILKTLRRGGRFGRRSARSLSKGNPLSAGLIQGRRLHGEVKRINAYVNKLLLLKQRMAAVKQARSLRVPLQRARAR